MSDPGAVLTGPWGPVIAIAAMSLATYLCRISGAIVMSRVSLTRRMERGLRALPGSIVMATILPVALDNGPPAILSLVATTAAMILTRKELVGLAAGLGTLSLIRALGF
jgi:uncharacterized membrane protein